MTRGTCTACGARLRWAKTIIGKPIPLDYAPNPAGNVTLDADGRAHVHGSKSLPPPGATMYMPHHASCTKWKS